MPEARFPGRLAFSARSDQIHERKGSRQDYIRAKDGDDTINARRAGRDADTVRAGQGEDTVFANDRDTSDSIDCGQGEDDQATIDVVREDPALPTSRITASDQVSPDCETIRDQNGNPVRLTDLSPASVVDMEDDDAS